MGRATVFGAVILASMAFVSDAVAQARISADLFGATMGKANIREGSIDSALAVGEWPRDLDLLIATVARVEAATDHPGQRSVSQVDRVGQARAGVVGVESQGRAAVAQVFGAERGVEVPRVGLTEASPPCTGSGIRRQLGECPAGSRPAKILEQDQGAAEEQHRCRPQLRTRVGLDRDRALGLPVTWFRERVQP